MLHQRGPKREMHFGKRRTVDVVVIFWKVQDLGLRHRAVFGVPTTDDQTADRIIDCEAGDPVADGGHLTRELDPGHISNAVGGCVLAGTLHNIDAVHTDRMSTDQHFARRRFGQGPAGGMTSATQRTST